MPQHPHHPRIARRVDALLSHPDAGGESEEPFSTRGLGLWLGVSPATLEIWRSIGGGPPFVRLGPSLIRYRRGDVNAWLRSLRSHQSTAEYACRQQAGPGRPRKAVGS